MRISRISSSSVPHSFIAPVSKKESSSPTKGVSRAGDDGDSKSEPVGASRVADPLQELAFVDGDAETSQDMWSTLSDQVPDGYSPSQSFMDLVDQSQAGLAYYSAMFRMTGLKPLSAKQSLQHVTLPEAMLLASFLQGELSAGFHRLVMKPVLSRVQKESVCDHMGRFKRGFKVKHIPKQGVIRSQLSLISNNEPAMRWMLGFHVHQLKASIKCKGKRVGLFQYELEHGRLEKIIGSYNQLSLVLDPVWSQKGISFERLKVGAFTGDLIREGNSKKANWRKQTALDWKMSVTNMASAKMDQHTFMTKKNWSLGPCHVHTRLLFSRYLLMPLAVYSSIYIDDVPAPKKMRRYRPGWVGVDLAKR